MNFFTSGFFWFLEGVLFCSVIMGLRTWSEDRGIPMPYWKWVLVILWILLFGFTIAFIGTSIGENEKTAAVRGGLLFGSIAIVLFFCLWHLLGFRRKR